MENDIKIALDGINDKLDSIDNRLQSLDNKIDTHNIKIISIEKDIEYMKKEREEDKKENKEEHDKICKMVRDKNADVDKKITWLYRLLISTMIGIIGYGIKLYIGF